MVSSCHLIVRRELGSRIQEASPLVGKNAWLVLVPCCTWKCVAHATITAVDIPKVLGCPFFDKWVLSKDHKKYFKDSLSWTYSLTFWCLLLFWHNEMTVLSKVCEPDNLESNNYLKFNQKSCHKWDNGQDFGNIEESLHQGMLFNAKM